MLFLRPSTLRKCAQACRGEVSCVSATFTLVLISFALITLFNINRAPTILTVLDDLPLDVEELKREALGSMLLEQDNGEVYIAFRINSSSKLLSRITNVREAVHLAESSKKNILPSSASVTKIDHNDIEAKPVTSSDRLDNDVDKSNVRREEMLRLNPGLQYPISSFGNPYLINNKDLCGKDGDLSFVVLVHTSTEHFMRRSSIRETWANSMLFNNHSMKIVFLLGRAVKESTQTLIEHEQKTYKDLVQGDFLDSYRNLTHKGVLGYRWVAENCPQARFIVKIDDDVFVNVFKLIEKLDTEMHNKTRMFWCPIRLKGTSPIQRTEGKWKVDEHEFTNMTHYNVTYCNGFFVIISRDIIAEMFEASKTTKFFWVDDVYLFGLLPAKIDNVKHEPLPNLNLNEEKAIECFQSKEKPCNMLVANAHSDGVMDKLWFGVLQQYKTLAKKYSKETLFTETR